MGLINHITWTCCSRTNGNSHWHCQHPYGSGANNWELVNIMTESSRSFQKCYRHWGNRFFWADGILLSAPIVGSWWNHWGIMAGSHIIHSQLHLVLQPTRVLTLCFYFSCSFAYLDSVFWACDVFEDTRMNSLWVQTKTTPLAICTPWYSNFCFNLPSLLHQCHTVDPLQKGCCR